MIKPRTTLKEEISLQNIVESYEGKLTKVDRQLRNAILGQPTQSAFLSGSDLAEGVGVHPSSTVRLAHKLGFSGYPQLREKIRQGITSSSTPDIRMRRRLDHLESSSVLGGLIETEIATLQQLVQAIPQERIEQAARMITQADTVYLYGRGSSMPLVNLLDRRLRRAGKRVISISGLQRREAAERFLALSKNDVVFSFAFRSKESAPASLPVVFDHAKKLGAKTILVSDALGSTFRPRPDVMFHASRGEDEEFVTITAPMLICDAIALTMMKIDGGKSMESLKSLNELRNTFENYE
jgi:DNA-binding MurR/RpiR family transcriptional regulator